jgi:threonine dehydrogenase-like Zn-dependent dehydrogenase
MKASFLVGPEKSEVREIPLPSVEDNEALIRVEACGVCMSDMHRWKGGGKGDYPLRMGHEPSGVIEQIGSQVQGLEVGQRVAALAPGRGAFAEYITVPQEHVILMPPGMAYTEAIAEPVGCLVSGLERTDIHLADRVAIIGCGFMGLALLQLVANRGPREIIAIDVREDALENALRFGADQALHPNKVRPNDKVVEWSQIGQGVDVVVETTGTQPGLTLAGQMTKVHGILSIVGWHVDGMRTVDIGLWNWKAITVINAHERRMDYLVRCMEAGLHLIAAGKLDMASLVMHTYPLTEVDTAFTAMQDKPTGFIKAVVLPQT